jgi:hypothetical protein
VFWWKLNTCGNETKQRAILGNMAQMVLTWTVATAVFDALDIFATLFYDAESSPAITSAVFSLCSAWYGLFQRKADLAVLAKIGTKKISLNERKKRVERAALQYRERKLKEAGKRSKNTDVTDAEAVSAQPNPISLRRRTSTLPHLFTGTV